MFEAFQTQKHECVCVCSVFTLPSGHKQTTIRTVSTHMEDRNMLRRMERARRNQEVQQQEETRYDRIAPLFSGPYKVKHHMTHECKSDKTTPRRHGDKLLNRSSHVLCIALFVLSDVIIYIYIYIHLCEN